MKQSDIVTSSIKTLKMVLIKFFFNLSKLHSFFLSHLIRVLTKVLPTFWILCCHWASLLRISLFWAWVLESEKSWIPLAVLPLTSLVTVWTSLSSPVKQESWYYLAHTQSQWDALHSVSLRAFGPLYAQETLVVLCHLPLGVHHYSTDLQLGQALLGILFLSFPSHLGMWSYH